MSVDYYNESYPPWVFTPTTGVKGDAQPGDVFIEPTITAENALNAAKLGPLGYVANPLTLWNPGEYITVTGHRFYWGGSAWNPGDNAAEARTTTKRKAQQMSDTPTEPTEPEPEPIEPEPEPEPVPEDAPPT